MMRTRRKECRMDQFGKPMPGRRPRNMVRNYYSPGHSREWVPIDDAIPAIQEEASVWAVRRYSDLHS